MSSIPRFPLPVSTLSGLFTGRVVLYREFGLTPHVTVLPTQPGKSNQIGHTDGCVLC